MRGLRWPEVNLYLQFFFRNFILFLLTVFLHSIHIVISISIAVINSFFLYSNVEGNTIAKDLEAVKRRI